MTEPSDQTPLRFVCVPDVHGAVPSLRDALDFAMEHEPDAILACGDFAAPRNELPALERIRDLLDATGLPAFAVPGNHDRPDAVPARNLDHRIVELEGIRIHGVGGAGPDLMGFPYEWTDEELAQRDFPDWDLLLTHAPPRNCSLDRTEGDRHVGSRVLRREAERRPGMLICGHIHEAAGTEPIRRCLCYNTGSLGRPHGEVQIGLVTVADEASRRTWSVEHHVRRSGEWTRAFRDRLSHRKAPHG